MPEDCAQFLHNLLTISQSVNLSYCVPRTALGKNLSATKLRLIETTDLHMQLSGYDYLRDKPNPDRGLARLAPKITALRNEGIATLLLDNGDFLQGTPLADTAIADLKRGIPHPMIAALNLLEYDAITLGNHEFDYGLDALSLALKDCKIPVVSANVRTSPTAHLVQPWTIIDREVVCDDGTSETLRLGVIGLVTPQISDWNKHLLRRGRYRHMFVSRRPRRDDAHARHGKCCSTSCSAAWRRRRTGRTHSQLFPRRHVRAIHGYRYGKMVGLRQTACDGGL